jgi:amino-acid N-acetyltransferase
MPKSPQISYRFHRSSELPLIASFLREYELPHEDVSSKIKFIAAYFKQEMIGCIGVEAYTDHGLLRSLAVKKDFQNQGIGGQLINYLIGYCHQTGIETLHLLTVSSSSYFQRMGFQPITRDQAPKEIAQTEEFTTLCPASESTYMFKTNLSGTVRMLPKSLMHWNTDADTGSSYWEITGTKQSFTFFKVPSHRKFPKHQHESEQITHVLEGKLFFKIDKQVFTLGAGDSIVIPSNKWHSVWTEDQSAVAVDSWAPGRDLRS